MSRERFLSWALLAVVAADLVWSAWQLAGRPGGRCPACRARLGPRHDCRDHWPTA